MEEAYSKKSVCGIKRFLASLRNDKVQRSGEKWKKKKAMCGAAAHRLLLFPPQHNDDTVIPQRSKESAFE